MISAATPNALCHPHAHQCSMTRKGRKNNNNTEETQRKTLAKEPEGELKQPEKKGNLLKWDKQKSDHTTNLQEGTVKAFCSKESNSIKRERFRI